MMSVSSGSTRNGLKTRIGHFCRWHQRRSYQLSGAIVIQTAMPSQGKDGSPSYPGYLIKLYERAYADLRPFLVSV